MTDCFIAYTEVASQAKAESNTESSMSILDPIERAKLMKAKSSDSILAEDDAEMDNILAAAYSLVESQDPTTADNEPFVAAETNLGPIKSIGDATQIEAQAQVDSDQETEDV